jgi:hypothetical protein
VKLRDFDKDDWAAYAGCETDTPFIGHGKDFTVIVDGRWVEVHPQDDLTSAHPFRFPAPGMAVAFALSLRGTELIDDLTEAAELHGHDSHRY